MPMSINRTAAVALLPGEGEVHSAMGVTLTFKTVGSQSDGRFLALEYEAPPHFSGPPAHWHKVTTEIFYVLEGALTVSVSGSSVTLGPGGYAFVPPGVVHTFDNQSDAPARFFTVASPSGLEHYFTELKEMLASESVWPPKDTNKLMALMAKYDTFAPPAR